MSLKLYLRAANREVTVPKKIPYMRLYAGRDIFMGPGFWSLTVYWKPSLFPTEAELKWMHYIELRVRVPQFKVTWI